MLEAILTVSGINLALLFTIVFRAGIFVQRVNYIEKQVEELQATVNGIECIHCKVTGIL